MRRNFIKINSIETDDTKKYSLVSLFTPREVDLSSPYVHKVYISGKYMLMDVETVNLTPCDAKLATIKLKSHSFLLDLFNN